MQLQLRNIINLPLSITIPFSLLIDLYILINLIPFLKTDKIKQKSLSLK
jgi:hypothetical protein